MVEEKGQQKGYHALESTTVSVIDIYTTSDSVRTHWQQITILFLFFHLTMKHQRD